MMPMMMPPAQAIAEILNAAAAGPIKVLDIAAGHGIFGIVIAQRNPQAEIVAVDWAGVLKVATENAAQMGVAARHKTLPGDAFTADWGTGYDVALMTNFLHHFDIPTCTTLLKKVAASLKPGGRIAVLEFVPNDDRVSPPMAASFAMQMLGGTPSGDAYTLAELTSMLKAAGFATVSGHPLQGPQTLVVGTK
jgi:2-polyprenyl-3-methyl-5-hydroxy-6-metoxy-1,4-benzoquinol methylase